MMLKEKFIIGIWKDNYPQPNKDNIAQVNNIAYVTNAFIAYAI
jgi:hypothetical protein